MEEKQEEKSNPLKQIRTFQGDVAEALKRQQESLVSIQQAEVSKRGFANSTNSAQDTGSRKTFLLLVGTALLLLLGAIGLWYAYGIYIKTTAVPVLVEPKDKFFAVDKEDEVNISNFSRLDFIKRIRDLSAGTKPLETKQFRLTNTDAIGFFKILEARAPGSLMRAIDPNFMTGSYGESLFIIFKLNSFQNAYAGMLNWEENLREDIVPLFATASILRDSTTTPVFIDITDRNKDLRALESDGRNVVLYSFYENSMLIITDEIETLRTLVERLTREKLSR